LGAFAEMVGVGLKEIGLGTPMKAEDLDPLMEEAQKIVKRHNVHLYRETSFIITDLFPKSVARGLDLLIVYKGESLKKYMSLKDRKKELLEKGTYKGRLREEISFELGDLLSYSKEAIKKLIKNNPEKE